MHPSTRLSKWFPGLWAGVGLSVLLAICVVTPSADAEEMVILIPATDIGAACLDHDNKVSTEICYAYVLGVMQSNLSVAELAGTEPPFCLPEEVTRKQALAAVAKHFRRRLDQSTISADRFVVQALAARFPCEQP